MEHLCEQLDALLVEHLELVMAYRSRSERISLHMNQGFLQLTQAKFIMGSRHLSSSQYDRRMLASLTIQLTEENTEDSNSVDATSFQLKVTPFEMPAADNDDGDEDEDGYRNAMGEPATAIEVHSPTALTSRHRMDMNTASASSSSSFNYHTTAASNNMSHSGIGTTATEVSGQRNESNLYPGSGMGAPPKKEAFRMTRMRTWTNAGKRDPVTWYGVLVPGALRAAQTQFRQGITDMVHLASLRANILAHEKRIAQLLAQKRQWQQEELASSLPTTCSQEDSLALSPSLLTSGVSSTDWETNEFALSNGSNSGGV
ncbi:hypothetical protein BDF22DRAFT_742464 [Syncephalis plumigaleata]|nr:hypothetical protein BDF22DRAFT_742464 [Syncephalis plumigaleata]